MCGLPISAFSFVCFFTSVFVLFQVRAADEMNYDFQALALESRGMGEVRFFFFFSVKSVFFYITVKE